MTFGEIGKKIAKGTAIGAISLATIVGTFTGNEHSLAPIFNNKVGTNYGICIGLGNRFDTDSKFYGIAIGLFNNLKTNSQVNGLVIGVENQNYDSELLEGAVNGIELGIINFAHPGYVLQGGVLNGAVNSGTPSTYSIGLGIASPSSKEGN